MWMTQQTYVHALCVEPTRTRHTKTTEWPAVWHNLPAVQESKCPQTVAHKGGYAVLVVLASTRALVDTATPLAQSVVWTICTVLAMQLNVQHAPLAPQQQVAQPQHVSSAWKMCAVHVLMALLPQVQHAVYRGATHVGHVQVGSTWRQAWKLANVM